MEHRHNAALGIGAVVFTAGAAMLVAAAVIAVQTPADEANPWFRVLLIGGFVCTLVGLYLLLAVWLGLPLPEPRSSAVWSGRIPRQDARRAKAERALLERLRQEAKYESFEDPQAGDALFVALTEPEIPRTWHWEYLGGSKYLCSYGQNRVGSVHMVSDSDTAMETFHKRFDDVVERARTWPQALEWSKVTGWPLRAGQ